jgi:hypothetical protein
VLGHLKVAATNGKRAALIQAALYVAFRIQLAMSTAAMAATAVVPVTAAIATADEATRVAASVPVDAMSVVSSPAIISTTAVISTAAIICTATVEATAIVAAVVPRAGADEDAADEVIRPIVAVGGASVRIVTVVTVGTNRSGADGAVNGAYPDAYANLRLGSTSGKKQNSQ